MLKKLFAHEWKACWRLMALVNGLVLAITLLGIIVFRNDFWDTINRNGSPVLAITFTLYFLVYMISIGALSFVVSLYFYVRFFNNLYTDQGYLMHTLPVTPGHLIWSKAFVGVIWQFISGLVIAFSVLSFFLSIMVGNDVELGRVWSEIWTELTTSGDGWKLVLMFLLVLVMAIVSSFMSIFLGYTAISIGQLCKKQKILGAIGAYIGIYLILQIAGSFATVPLAEFFDKMSYTGSDDFVQMAGMVGIAIVAAALVTTGLYFINEYIMKFKLNLE